MCVDVAAYHGFCLLALGVCIRVIVLDGMWLPTGQSHTSLHDNTDAHTERMQTEPMLRKLIQLILIFQLYLKDLKKKSLHFNILMST
jgi:hypothetical protein